MTVVARISAMAVTMNDDFSLRFFVNQNGAHIAAVPPATLPCALPQRVSSL